MAGRKTLNPEDRKSYKGKNIPIFCDRVRLRRLELQMTQAGLADLIGTKTPRVSELEGGRMTSDCDRIIALARALETTPDYLFGFREKP